MTEEDIIHCTKCGAIIQQRTAERTGGLCMPCKTGRVRPRQGEPVVRTHFVDSMCIGIEKAGETQDYVDYVFTATVYDPDPERPSRMMRVGENRGRLRIVRESGEVLLLEPMPEDSGDVRFARAAAVMRKHWAKSAFPDKTMFASG